MIAILFKILAMRTSVSSWLISWGAGPAKRSDTRLCLILAINTVVPQFILIKPTNVL
jgi:hypothetical protein